MIKRKVDKSERERTSRGVWKTPEQRGKKENGHGQGCLQGKAAQREEQDRKVRIADSKDALRVARPWAGEAWEFRVWGRWEGPGKHGGWYTITGIYQWRAICPFCPKQGKWLFLVDGNPLHKFLRSAGFSLTTKNPSVVQLERRQDCPFWTLSLPKT